MNWDSFTLHCVCGEQVLFIPPELKEESFKRYDIAGISAVIKLIDDAKANQKIESDRISKITLKVLEDQKLNETLIIHESEVEHTRPRNAGTGIMAITIFSSIVLIIVIAYLSTPIMVRYAGIIAKCDIQYADWSFADYIWFWFQVIKYSIGFILASFFALFVLRVYLKSEDENPSSPAGWVKAGAVIGALSGKNAVHGAVKGAAAGYAGHSIIGAIGLIIIIIIALLPLSLLEESIQENMCLSNMVGESSAKKPAALSNGIFHKERTINILSPEKAGVVFDCNALAKYVVNDSKNRGDKPKGLHINSLITGTTYKFYPLDYTSCDGKAKLSNGVTEELYYWGGQQEKAFILKYRTAD
jgi:hypothetical protein